MKKRKLNYQFHNPNPAAATADYILKILLEEKVQSAIQAATDGLKDMKEEIDEGHPA